MTTIPLSVTKAESLRILALAAAGGDAEAREYLMQELSDPAVVVSLLASTEHAAARAAHFQHGLEQIASCDSHVKGDVVDVAQQTLQDAPPAPAFVPKMILDKAAFAERVIANLRKAKMTLFGHVTLAIEEAIGLLDPEPPFYGEDEEEDERKYPCADCGKMRTAAEGGTTFTVCDECWDKHYGKKKRQPLPTAATDEEVAQILTDAMKVDAEDVGSARWFEVYDRWRSKWTTRKALSLVSRIHEMGAEYRILKNQAERALRDANERVASESET